jgi:hypothetical protein
MPPAAGSLPAQDFTFVCPTEIIAFSDRAKEFEALNCQVGWRGRCGCCPAMGSSSSSTAGRSCSAGSPPARCRAACGAAPDAA